REDFVEVEISSGEDDGRFIASTVGGVADGAAVIVVLVAIGEIGGAATEAAGIIYIEKAAFIPAAGCMHIAISYIQRFLSLTAVGHRIYFSGFQIQSAKGIFDRRIFERDGIGF